nr:hypothetical protein [uncultured Blautia sp.]
MQKSIFYGIMLFIQRAFKAGGENAEVKITAGEFRQIRATKEE